MSSDLSMKRLMISSLLSNKVKVSLIGSLFGGFEAFCLYLS